MINCTFVGNLAGESGGVMYSANTDYFESSAMVTNCILWGNTHDQVVDDLNAVTTITHSIVEHGWTGSGTHVLDVDPLFVDPDGPDNDPSTLADNDYHLARGSPGVDAGDNAAVPDGADVDLDGKPRFADDPGMPDTGHGDPPLVDLGCYEFQPCPGDLNGDGNRDFIDFIIFSNAWLTQLGDPNWNPACDLNGDGSVDYTDFTVLSNGWLVPCP